MYNAVETNLSFWPIAYKGIGFAYNITLLPPSPTASISKKYMLLRETKPVMN